MSDTRILAPANDIEWNADVRAARTYGALMQAVRQAKLGIVTGESLQVLVEVQYSR